MMGRTKKILIFAFCLVLTLTMLIMAGCGENNDASGSDNRQEETAIDQQEDEAQTIDYSSVPLDNEPEKGVVLTPVASGVTVYKNTNVCIDASNINQGYIMIQYTGSNPKIKVQIAKSGSETYTYDLNARNTYEVFPLSEGDGEYSIKVFESIEGAKYSQAFSQDVTVALDNQYIPFLYPNQYVNFTADSETVKKAVEVTKDAQEDVEVIGCVYNYVVDNFAYDKEKAATVKSGYLPVVDEVLAAKSGICFDYAAVMAAMLRSQNVPAKLVVGYTGSIYHAWINVYIEGTGWVDGMIFFDGKAWELMDPTFASSGKKSEEIMQYISDSSNYTQKYVY